MNETRHIRRERCKELRSQGYSLGEICSIMKLPKTTVYGYIKNIALSDELKIKIEEKRRIRLKNIPNPIGITGKINRSNIEISGKENLVRFAKEINFSPRIYINPQRKNSIWRRKIDKRKILSLAIKSYRN
jgi:hypothetical protein